MVVTHRKQRGTGKTHTLVRVKRDPETTIFNVVSWVQADWLMWNIMGEIMCCVTPGSGLIGVLPRH